MKAKLATQEVELKHKNEAADKLIQVVGVETEKVSREKAIADEEEQKVALIMLEVKQKQKDCEEDLAKAEPALTAAQEALNTLNKVGGWFFLPSLLWGRTKRQLCATVFPELQGTVGKRLRLQVICYIDKHSFRLTM